MMKNHLFLFMFAFILFGCTETIEDVQETNQTLEFGDVIAEDKLLSNEEFRSLIKSKSEIDCVISGTIIALCNDKSCDFKITMFDGRDIMVKLGANLNFIAKNQINQSIILSGTASLDPKHENLPMFQAKGIKILGTNSDKE